jgi:hypothetical protein
VLHAHIVLLYGNLQPEEMTADNLGQLLGSLAYVRTEHGYGTIMRNLEMNDAGDREAEMESLRNVAEAVAETPGAEVDVAARQAAQVTVCQQYIIVYGLLRVTVSQLANSDMRTRPTTQARLDELTIESDGQSGMFSEDKKRIEKMAIKAIMTFLQSKGVDTTELNEDHFKKYLTGEPLFFVRGGQVTLELGRTIALYHRSAMPYQIH